MTCKTVMLHDPIKVYDTATLGDAIELLYHHQIKTLPVVNAQGIYQGLFGIHTLVGRLLPRAATLDKGAGLTDLTFVHDNLDTLCVRLMELLPEPVLQFTDRELRPISPDASLMETLLLLYRHRHNMPVVDPRDGRLVGFVTSWGVLGKLAGMEG